MLEGKILDVKVPALGKGLHNLYFTYERQVCRSDLDGGNSVIKCAVEIGLYSCSFSSTRVKVWLFVHNLFVNTITTYCPSSSLRVDQVSLLSLYIPYNQIIDTHNHPHTLL